MIDYSPVYVLSGVIAAYLVFALFFWWCVSNAEEYDGDDF